MKKITLLLSGLALTAVLLNSCKDKCDGENPRARVLNNGTAVASVQIKTSEGNTVNINNVEPASASAYAEYAPGEIVFTITVGKILVIDTVTMANCYEYDIAIDAVNHIITTPKNRND